MTKEQFIENVAKYVKKYAPLYGIKCYSAVISQAILESACGTSELAINANNFFGLKYNPKQPKRCPTACGYYTKQGSEQLANGSYISSTMLWQKFPSFESGIKGYFDFINNSNYANLKGITEPQKYLETIRADKYCTSLSYVQNCMNVVRKYNLTKYDVKGSDNDMAYTNSSLICYTKLSPNKSARTHKIDTITIHCMAGNLSVETCGNVFAPTSRRASSNYGIGSDGRIAMYVEEKNRSWCSSNSANDNRAITIEVANDGGAPDWHVSDKAMDSLIKLCADICKRNGIKELKWKGDKKLIGQVDKQNMTVHRWFAAKSCPGDYIYNHLGYIANEVNKILNNTSTPSSTPVQSQSQSQSSTNTSIYVNQFTPLKGNPTHFAEIIKNIKLALNTDYGLKFTIDSSINDILLINLGNVVLSTVSYKKNITYALQQLLAWWGYDILIDGIFGNGTKSTISLFQSQVRIAKTGTTTKEFWHKILGK